MMNRNASGAFDADNAASENGRSPPDAGQINEDRSPRPDERDSEEPGFFGQIVQFLKPRPVSSLRESFVEALAKAEIGTTGFTPAEHKMLTHVLALHEVRVEDIMIPRSEIDAIDAEATLGEAMLRFEETGRSRMPVYGEGLDDPRGMIHIRDAVRHITQSALASRGEEARSCLDVSRIDLDRPISELGLVRKVLFVPPSMPAAELMGRMQAAHIQMALVIDEYGGTDGLVSLEDTIEMIVGDIEDEHDDDEDLVIAEPDGSFTAEARAELDDVRSRIGPDFDTSHHRHESETIGGLIVTELGRIPVEGEVLELVPGFRITVLEADSRRVKRVRIERLAGGPGASGPDADQVD